MVQHQKVKEKRRIFYSEYHGGKQGRSKQFHAVTSWLLLTMTPNWPTKPCSSIALPSVSTAPLYAGYRKENAVGGGENVMLFGKVRQCTTSGSQRLMETVDRKQAAQARRHTPTRPTQVTCEYAALTKAVTAPTYSTPP